MNRKGFTLIELVVTIALLAIISVISFVSISGVIKQSKVSNCNDLVNNIKSATKDYVSDNRYGVINTNITAETLISGKYLSGPIVNPFDNTDINPGSVRIKIELNTDYTTKNIIIEAPDILKNCESE